MSAIRIIDGATVTDIRKNESGFNYYLMLRPGGSGIIMRENTAETEYRFFVFGGKNTPALSATNVDTLFADRVNLDYVRPSSLKNL